MDERKLSAKCQDFVGACRDQFQDAVGSATFFSTGDKSMTIVIKGAELMYSNDNRAYETNVQARFKAATAVAEQLEDVDCYGPDIISSL